MKAKYILGGAVLAVLVGGLVLQFAQIRNVKKGDTQTEANPIGLSEKIPPMLSGWKGRDEPLGPNEFMQSAVEKTLNYDDFVNRIYERGGRSVGIYVAFWTAGRMPVQKVASHTPDRCWTENGWVCDDARFPEKLTSGAGRLKPAYWRIFRPPGAVGQGAQQYVLYWHLVGNELYDYGDGFNQRADPIKWWKETVHYAIKGSAEQYFIRLTSNVPFEDLQDDPGYQELLESLADLGLGEATKSPDG